MIKRCIKCSKSIEEEYGKLQGTILKVKEDDKNRFVYVCSECQREDNWIEKAEIKSV